MKSAEKHTFLLCKNVIGAIYENVVAEGLLAHGFENLFYYNSKKMGEVDFVTEYNGNVFPIEVKSGKDYVRHKALNNILECKEYTIPEALVLCNDNLNIKSSIKYLPVYMIMIMFIYRETRQCPILIRPQRVKLDRVREVRQYKISLFQPWA